MTNSQTNISTSKLVIGFDYPLCQIPDLCLSPGKAIRIAAPNGLGKTTFFRTLMGLHPPMSGTFCINRSSISYLSADHMLPSTPSVLCAANFFAAMEQIPVEDILLAAKHLGMTALLDAPLQTLSSGQVKRLALCRSLASASSILLLDEPFTSLDQKYAQTASELLTDTAKQKLVIYISHGKEIAHSQIVNLTPFDEHWLTQ